MNSAWLDKLFLKNKYIDNGHMIIYYRINDTATGTKAILVRNGKHLDWYGFFYNIKAAGESGGRYK